MNSDMQMPGTGQRLSEIFEAQQVKNVGVLEHSLSGPFTTRPDDLFSFFVCLSTVLTSHTSQQLPFPFSFSCCSVSLHNYLPQLTFTL